MSDPIPLSPHGFVLARELRARGRENQLITAVGANRLERVRRGVYAVPGVEAGADGAPRSRASKAVRAAREYRSLVLAAGDSLRAPVFTSWSAVALHHLPIIGAWPKEVYRLSADSHGYRRPTTVMVARLADVPLVEIDGLLVSSLEHTLIQLCRHAPLGPALVAVEAALSRMPWSRTPAKTTIEALRAEHERLAPYPGCRRTAAVLRRATALSATPLETCSKLVFEEFGFPQPVQQQSFWLPESEQTVWVDFYWPEHDAVGEADGDVKYLSAVGRDAAAPGPGAAVPSGIGAARAVIAEKKREQELRRLTRATDRWDWNEMWRRQPLVARLLAMDLPMRGRRVHLF